MNPEVRGWEYVSFYQKLIDTDAVTLDANSALVNVTYMLRMLDAIDRHQNDDRSTLVDLVDRLDSYNILSTTE